MLKPEIEAAYTSILQEELVLATGCTEPIAIAYAAAKLRQTLGALPQQITAEVSGNIIKNVKSVVVPNTGGLKGIEAAVAAGVVAGDADRELQVISSVPPERHQEIASYLANTPIQVVCADTPHILDIRLTGRAGGAQASVRIADRHSNIVEITKDGQVLLHKPLSDTEDGVQTDRGLLNLHDILTYAEQVPLEKVSALLDRQIQCNTAIAQEGLEHDWGANIGSTILKEYGNDIKSEARAWAAAGSDARMSGCEMPVVILSGSGNQGMTASLPVIEYARDMGVDEEAMIRALVVSDLVTIHQKTGIGRLSAFCGAVSAGCGAAAGIAYLKGGRYEVVAHTIANALAICSGMICDGAKPSCAAKIAAAVDAGLMGYYMYTTGSHQFVDGEGIIKKGVENTIDNVGRLAREGMRRTDEEILHIMVGQ